MNEWEFLAKKYKIEGARVRFEEICTSFLSKKFDGDNVKSPRVSAGDGGIDVFVGELGINEVDVYQCKFFLNGIADAQKQQIRESFRRMISAVDYKTSSWTLCLPIQLSKEEHLWFSGWKSRQEEEYHLKGNFIRLLDGLELLDGLKEYGLYDQTFDEDLRKSIASLLKSTAAKQYDLGAELARGSSYINGLKNYFSVNNETHQIRAQTSQVLEWISTESKGQNNLEKLLVIKGKKGVGKSTIITDVYRELISRGENHALAVKCDQYYDVNTEDLAKQLFSSGISFEDIFSKVENSGKPIIVLFDQLDALSQTLSTDRRWLKTYISLIDHLLLKKDIRIILSTRSFDLDYDADLIRFSDQQFVKHIEVDCLSVSEVTSVLKLLGIEVKNNQLLELLRLPYNLELFSKIPDLSSLNIKDVQIDISRLHAELYSQLLKGRDLQLTVCLNEIVQRMYLGLPNMVNQQHLSSFSQETDYFISHGILIKNGSKLAFFHQSFYEYYLARWFVDEEKDLIAYIFEQEQNLYIRSLIKNVIDYLREADHARYITLYKCVLDNKTIRYHIHYLFITNLGQVDLPSDREKEFVYHILNKSYGQLFFETFTSSGWLNFLLDNECLPKEITTLYPIFYRNLLFNPKRILDFIERFNLEEKHNLFTNLLPGIEQWTVELLPYFEKYYPYTEQNELWYFNMLKKIAIVEMEFVLDKLRPIFVAQRRGNDRIKFDYRYDSIVETLYEINAKATVEFLLGIQLEILEGTQYAYFSTYEEQSSPLLASRHYGNGLYYKESKDEKSIEAFLLKYYRSCDRTELTELYLKYRDSNFVPLLSLIMKLLRDRATEFVDEIFLLLKIIEGKNGLNGNDDFFSLQIRRLIASSIIFFNNQQYRAIKKILLAIRQSNELYIGADGEGKRKVCSKIGLKKYLFLKALPTEIIKNDGDIRTELLVLQRRYGLLDHNRFQDRGGITWHKNQSALNNPNFEKFNHKAWLSSMRKIHEGYRHEGFMRGDILDHSRSFESTVEKAPGYFYEFIDSLFKEEGISPRYISHGISALIKVKDNIEKTAELIYKEMDLSLNREYTQYAMWHCRFLIEHKKVTSKVVEYWVKVAKWEPHENDTLNPGMEMSDFINTPRGTALDNLMHLGEYPEFADCIFDTIEYIIRPGQVPIRTLTCGIMANIAYLNVFDQDRAFKIFEKLVAYNDVEILKCSMNSAQYYKNTRHDQMAFYFKQVILYPELYETSYFFITSWVYDRIDDYEMYDEFMKLGEKALHCAMRVAEKLFIGENGIDERCLNVLERCLEQKEVVLSHEFSGLVLRTFEISHFLQLYNFIGRYVTTSHFAKDPRYLFEYLTECSAYHPAECLNLLCKMDLPFDVNIRETAYLGDEPLILVLAIYSKLRNLKFKYLAEQQLALDQFDRMLTIPSIRGRALEAMNKVLN